MKKVFWEGLYNYKDTELLDVTNERMSDMDTEYYMLTKKELHKVYTAGGNAEAQSMAGGRIITFKEWLEKQK